METLIAILFMVNLSLFYTIDNSLKNQTSGECHDYTFKVYELAKHQIPEIEILLGCIGQGSIPDGVYKFQKVPDIHNYLGRGFGNGWYNYQNNKRLVTVSITNKGVYELLNKVSDIPEEYKSYNGGHNFPVVKVNGVYKVFDACSGYYDENGRRPSVFYNDKTQVKQRE